jgi:hypothetical protein
MRKSKVAIQHYQAYDAVILMRQITDKKERWENKQPDKTASD